MDERIAEFVVECTVDGDWLYPTDGGAVKRRYADEIVRCRDCERYYSHIHGCDLFAFDTWDSLTYADVEPDGFCKWGERREDK